jgi:hypothetical protein
MENHSSRMNMSALPREATAVGRRVVLVSIACVATGFAFAQSLELPNRHDVIEGIGGPKPAELGPVGYDGMWIVTFGGRAPVRTMRLHYGERVGP